MEDVATDEDRILEALHSCPKLCTHLGLQGLACLAACSNRLKIGCLDCCRREAGALTAVTIAAIATAKDSFQQEQQLEAVVWLLHAVPAAATTSWANRLTRVRRVP
jgi:hypothetical protein